MSIACILLVTENRIPLVRDVTLPAVLTQGFDEVLWVGDGVPGDGYRFLAVPPLSKTTNDALVKRDVGALATFCDILVYLSDDHAPAGDFVETLKRAFTHIPWKEWDALVPSRWCSWEGELLQLNMGENGGYCGGHGGVFKRKLIVRRPWTAMPHHPNWDALTSQIHIVEMGAKYVYCPSLRIIDLEPENRPWQ